MENNNLDKNQNAQKSIFSSSDDQTQKRLEDKGLDLKLAQSKYQKGDDLDSQILSQMVDNLDKKEDQKSNTQLLAELSTYNEFDNDLSIETQYSLKMKKRKTIYKNLFLIVLTTLIFVFSYWYQNKIINFSSQLFTSTQEVSNLDISYKSEFLYTTLVNSSVVNKQIAVLSLKYLEALRKSESVFIDESQKLAALDQSELLQDQLIQKFNELKLNFLKSQKNDLSDKSLLIETINSNSDLEQSDKSDLVALLKYSPILSHLNTTYSNLDKQEFLIFLNKYLELTNAIELNNLAFKQSTKFDQNLFLADLEATLQLQDPSFKLFQKIQSPQISLLSVDINPVSLTGSLNLNIQLADQSPLQDFIEFEDRILNSDKFKGDLSNSFNIESLSAEDSYNVNLKFKYL